GPAAVSMRSPPNAIAYRRRKLLAPRGPRKLPKLDVAGSTPVAHSREFEDLARCRQEPGVGGGSLVTRCSRGLHAPGTPDSSRARPAPSSPKRFGYGCGCIYAAADRRETSAERPRCRR